MNIAFAAQGLQVQRIGDSWRARAWPWPTVAKTTWMSDRDGLL